MSQPGTEVASVAEWFRTQEVKHWRSLFVAHNHLGEYSLDIASALGPALKRLDVSYNDISAAHLEEFAQRLSQAGIASLLTRRYAGMAENWRLVTQAIAVSWRIAKPSQTGAIVVSAMIGYLEAKENQSQYESRCVDCREEERDASTDWPVAEIVWRSESARCADSTAFISEA